MTKLLKNLGKEALFFIAATIGFCISIIVDSAAIGFLALTLLVVGGVICGRHYAQSQTSKKAKAHFSLSAKSQG